MSRDQSRVTYSATFFMLGFCVLLSCSYTHVLFIPCVPKRLLEACEIFGQLENMILRTERTRARRRVFSIILLKKGSGIVREIG